MSPIIQHFQLNKEALWQQLVTHKDALRYVYLESELAITLTYTEALLGNRITTPARFDQVAEPINFEYWAQGRAFGDDGELRWARYSDARYEMMWLTETKTDLFAEEIIQRAQDFKEAVDRYILLIGKYDSDKGYWSEARYPHPAFYPVESPRNKERVRLHCVDYCNNHLTLITRMKGIAREKNS